MGLKASHLIVEGDDPQAAMNRIGEVLSESDTSPEDVRAGLRKVVRDALPLVAGMVYTEHGIKVDIDVSVEFDDNERVTSCAVSVSKHQRKPREDREAKSATEPASKPTPSKAKSTRKSRKASRKATPANKKGK